MSYIGYNGIKVHSKYNETDFNNKDNKYNVCLINGEWDYSKPVGYCWLNGHRGYLNEALLKSHNCRQKQCPFLKKNETHGYWIEKERIKREKKQKKLLARFRQSSLSEIVDVIVENIYDCNLDEAVFEADKIEEAKDNISDMIDEFIQSDSISYESYEDLKVRILSELDKTFL